ncbi:hypothetical protein [Massilia glaciei]|uniref:Uncharacterized protein n=1 Tax=Massilia glaciei TaxID=1524097 RepID=A0A2U2HJT1_9BURK|nr:hypothetical protein [Massilia glaciei]PWF47790.1 hypothetical protein C7C56_014070 [Massilia glaciei]
MKTTFRSATWVATLVAAMATGGCAAWQERRHAQHHAGAEDAQPAAMAPGATGSSGATGASGSSGGGMGMGRGMMEMKAMCDMHKNMMSAKTPEERQAMMDERFKSMSPEMRKKHMEMMQACK